MRHRSKKQKTKKENDGREIRHNEALHGVVSWPFLWAARSTGRPGSAFLIPERRSTRTRSARILVWFNKVFIIFEAWKVSDDTEHNGIRGNVSAD